jgi:hypothetical protein
MNTKEHLKRNSKGRVGYSFIGISQNRGNYRKYDQIVYQLQSMMEKTFLLFFLKKKIYSKRQATQPKK